MTRLKRVVDLLLAAEPLPSAYKDHALTGSWTGYRDCHIQPDWILIYRVRGETLQLNRTGTQSDFFD